MKKEVIIDIKSANIYGRDKEETVILKGDYIHEDSNYIENTSITIKDEENNLEEYPLNINGYNLKLFAASILNIYNCYYRSHNKNYCYYYCKRSISFSLITIS